MWNVIIGGMINIFVLSYVNNYVYMIVMLTIGAAGIVLVSIFVEPFQISKLHEGQD